jgi:hypothetical protein
MKVRIQLRSIYHKFAEVEIEVPDNLSEDTIGEYLFENEDIYVDKIDEAMDEAPHLYGFAYCVVCWYGWERETS